MFDQAIGQRVEQFRIAGGVGQPQVIDFFDDADAEEIRPDPVGDGTGVALPVAVRVTFVRASHFVSMSR